LGLATAFGHEVAHWPSHPTKLIINSSTAVSEFFIGAFAVIISTKYNQSSNPPVKVFIKNGFHEEEMKKNALSFLELRENVENGETQQQFHCLPLHLSLVSLQNLCKPRFGSSNGH
jgi:uncharacterized protein (DUF608 family)